MNNHDQTYQQYFLVREMLDVKNVLAAMKPVQIFEFVKHIPMTGNSTPICKWQWDGTY